MTAPTRAPADGLDYRLVRVLQERVADRMTRETQTRQAHGQAPLTAPDERQLAISHAADVVAAHMRALLAAGADLPDPGVDRRLVEAIDAAMYGAGALQELLDDADIENIDINGCDEVWITYADDRGKVRGRPVAATDEDLIDIVRTLGAYAGLNARPFTPAHPELDLRLPDGSRLSAVMSASERPLVSVRRNRFPQMFLADVPRRRPPQRDPAADPAGPRHRRRPAGRVPAGRGLGPLQHRHRRRHRRRQDHPAAGPGQLHPARTNASSPSNAPSSSACGCTPSCTGTSRRWRRSCPPPTAAAACRSGSWSAAPAARTPPGSSSERSSDPRSSRCSRR